MQPRVRQRCRCQSDQCCRVVLWTKHLDPVSWQERQLLVPLKDINITGTIEAGHAHVMTHLVYSNTGHDNPVECTFEFPIEANTIVTKLAARIDNILVQARIKYKEPGSDDAQQSSHVAKRPTQNFGESIVLHLGTLLPEKSVRIDLQMVMPLSVNQGAYEFALPMSFLPKYEAHEVFIDPRQDLPHSTNLVPEYKCKYSFRIVDQSVTWISTPDDAQTTKLEVGYQVQGVSTEPKRAIRIQYKSNQMQEPQLKYQIDEQNGEVACKVSFVPTFEPIKLQELVITNEEPKATERSFGSEFCYIFLVDRYESMQGRPMEIAIKALLLFLKNLPAGSHFAIISFGSKLDFLLQETKTEKDQNTYEKAFNNLSVQDQPWRELLQQLGQQGFLDIKRNIDVCNQSQGQMSVMHDLLFQDAGQNQLADGNKVEKQNPIWSLDGENVEIVSQSISQFTASSASGSSILWPLKEAVKLDVGNRKRIIFLLTNISTSQTRCVPFAKESSHLARIHTFGIGKDCDETLLQNTAIAGRGSFTLLTDDSNDLSSKVTDALRRSFEPSLKNCVFKWPQQTINLNELFRYEQVNFSIILTLKEFNALQVTFHSDEDPISQQPVYREYLTDSFQRSELPLFQLAAHEMLQELFGKANQRCSVKYQVLSKHTAFIGFVKQKNFTTGEITRYKVPLARLVPTLKNHAQIAHQIEDKKIWAKPTYTTRSVDIESHMPSKKMDKTCGEDRDDRAKRRNLALQIAVPAPQVTPIKPDSQPDSYSVPKQALVLTKPQPLQIDRPKPIKVEAAVTKKRSLLESVSKCKLSLMSSLDHLQQQCRADLSLSQMQMFIEEQTALKIKRRKLKRLDVIEKQLKSKLTLQFILSLQSAQGYWPPESRGQVQQFFTTQLPPKVETTLAALCVLQSMFDNREDEWQMIAQKARQYLKTNGVNVKKDLAKIVNFVHFK